MLHELESGVDWLLNQESSSQSQAALLHTWDTRSKFIQVTAAPTHRRLGEVPAKPTDEANKGHEMLKIVADISSLFSSVGSVKGSLF